MIINFNNLDQFKGVTIGAVNACSGGGCTTQEIRIDGFGNPTDSTNVAFTNPATIALQSGSLTKTVRVTQQTSFSEVV